jgi:hypothetical protein
MAYPTGSPSTAAIAMDFAWKACTLRRSRHANQATWTRFTSTRAGIRVFNGKNRASTGSASTMAPKPVTPWTRCATRRVTASTP